MMYLYTVVGRKMTILVRYFAVLRERKGCNQEVVTLTTQVSVNDLYQKLFGEQSAGVRFAVNQMYVASSHLLQDGDELAFLPPLGGG